MSWLIIAVLVVTPIRVLADGLEALGPALVARFVFLLTLLIAVRTERVGPIRAGRLFLALAIASALVWSTASALSAERIALESSAYGTILPIFTMLMAPRPTRRWWTVGVAVLMTASGAARLLPDHATALAEVVAVILVHSVAVLAMDAYTDRAEEAGQMAGVDPLTGLDNRRPMLKRLTEQMQPVSSGGLGASVMIVDLDHFKELNDTFGHGAGDETLKEVAAVLSTSVRPTDSVCRWGGEEFLVLLNCAGSAEAQATAERIRQAIQTTGVTASVGVAQVVPDDTVITWVARADDAMYQAKQQGRNQVVHAAAPTPTAAEVSSR